MHNLSEPVSGRFRAGFCFGALGHCPARCSTAVPVGGLEQPRCGRQVPAGGWGSPALCFAPGRDARVLSWLKARQPEVSLSLRRCSALGADGELRKFRFHHSALPHAPDLHTAVTAATFPRGLPAGHGSTVITHGAQPSLPGVPLAPQCHPAPPCSPRHPVLSHSCACPHAPQSGQRRFLRNDLLTIIWL